MQPLGEDRRGAVAYAPVCVVYAPVCVVYAPVCVGNNYDSTSIRLRFDGRSTTNDSRTRHKNL